MADEIQARVDEGAYPFEVGTRVLFPLAEPCRQFVRGLQCSLADGYIIIKPFNSSFHYEQHCSNDHFVRNVKRAEVELVLGIVRTSPKTAVRDALTPSRRSDLNVLIRDGNACIYCGRRAGDVGLDGKPVVLSSDHIIPKALIDVEDINRDRELLSFARDGQLVAACGSHNSAKLNMLLSLDDARDVFIRHVLKGETRGVNVGKVSMFERLYRLADRNRRLRERSK